MAPTGSARVATAAAAALAPPSKEEPPVAFVIRSYEPRDHDAVAALFVQGMLSYAPTPQENASLHDEFHRYVKQALAQDIGHVEATYSHAGGHFWVVAATSPSGQDDGKEEKEKKEEVAAIVALQDKGDGTGELRRLSVDTKFRRHGLGVTLVTHVEQWATARGFRHIQLNCGCVMAPALHIYDRLGYARTHLEDFHGDYFLVWFKKTLA